MGCFALTALTPRLRTIDMQLYPPQLWGLAVLILAAGVGVMSRRIRLSHARQRQLQVIAVSLSVAFAALSVSLLWLPSGTAALMGNPFILAIFAALFLATLWICLATPKHGGYSTLLALLGLSVSAIAWIWQTYSTSTFLMGGLLPLSDANFYFQGAQAIFADSPQSTIADFTARRPIFISYLAMLFTFTGNHLPATQLLMACITGGLAWLLLQEINRTHGRLIALVVLGVYAFYASRFLGMTMTEQLGLPLGTFATLMLWRGYHQKDARLSGLAVGAFGVGLVVRAGAYLVLPMLLLWGVWFYRHQRRAAVSFVAIALLVIGMGFGLDSLIRQTFMPNVEGYGGNYAYSLYGLASGGKGWTYIYVTHPEIFTTLPPSEINNRIYELAFEQIRNDPQLFIQGMIYSVTAFILLPEVGIFSFFTLYPSGVGVVPLTYGLFAVTVFSALLKRRDPFWLLILAMLIGLFASALLVPPLDIDDMRVHAVMIPFVAILIALGVNELGTAWGLLAPRKPAAVSRSGTLAIIGLWGALVLCATVLPVGWSWLRPQMPATSAPTCPEAQHIALRTPAHRQNFLQLVPDDATRTSRTPIVRLSDLQQDPSMRVYPGFQEVLKTAVPPNAYMSFVFNIAQPDAPTPTLLIVEQDQLAALVSAESVCVRVIEERIERHYQVVIFEG